MPDDPRDVQHCRWAEPTIFRDSPEWTAAEEYPWSCKGTGEWKPVEDTGVCATCGRWAARAPEVVEAPPVEDRCHCACGDGCCDKG